MAYTEHTSVATPADVIDRIVTFADGAGWDVERNTVAGGLRTATIRKAGVTDYIHIYNLDLNSIRMRISIDYDPGLPPASQPKVSGECNTQLAAGPYPKMFLFAEGDDVWVTVGIARTGEYRHLTFGRLTKVGVYTGGTYIDGTDWGRSNMFGSFSRCRGPFLNNYGATYLTLNGRLRVDAAADGRSDFFYTFTDTGGVQGATSGLPLHAVTDLGIDLGGSASAMSLRADKNAFSGRSILHPIIVYVARTGSDTYYSPVGYPSILRACSMDKLQPEQEVPIGSDTYKVFPMAAKRPMYGTLGDLPAGSDMYGYAIRKTA